MAAQGYTPPETLIRWKGEVEVWRPPCLVILYGAELGRRLELHDEPVSIGRSPSCDLAPDVEDLSREHCRILPDGGGHVLVDANSTNGTFVGDRRLELGERVLLRGGERIRIGSLILKYLDGRDIEALYHEEIYRLTIIDGLTGLHNRRYFEEFMNREMARWRRYKRPMTLVLFDLDGLKAVNDEHGHPCGDEVLRQMAEVVQRVVRKEACLARLSGDEFCVGLPEISAERALIFAERLRGAVEAATFRIADNEVALTISLGLAEMTDEMGDLAGLIEAADRMLYAAKEQGRNCVAS